MQIGSRVVVHSVNGTTASSDSGDPQKNYRKLIGATGLVVEDPFTCCKYQRFSDERSVLVRFDEDVAALGSDSRGAQKNCLWISVADLTEDG
ncbi:hypothetical protein ACFL43_02125 [Thermodesulfobacteriota bacterium]